MEQPVEEVIIVYNPRVDDSFGAAWLMNKYACKYAKLSFVAEGSVIPLDGAENKHIIFLKTKYVPDVVLNLSTQFKTLLFIHNGSEIDDINVPKDGMVSLHEHLTSDKSFIVYSNIDQSVIASTWILLKPSDPLPDAVKLIDRQVRAICLDDRELKVFTLGLRSLERTFEAWDAILDSLDAIRSRGEEELTAYENAVKEAGDKSVSCCITTPDGKQYRGYMTQALAMYCTDVANYISINRMDDSPCFVGCYMPTADGKFSYSLRSIDLFDVLPICKAYGGGGNSKAGGFTTDQLIHV